MKIYKKKKYVKDMTLSRFFFFFCVFVTYSFLFLVFIQMGCNLHTNPAGHSSIVKNEKPYLLNHFF